MERFFGSYPWIMLKKPARACRSLPVSVASLLLQCNDSPLDQGKMWLAACGVEQVADLAGERRAGERLDDQLDPWIEPPLMHDGVAGIAGWVQHFPPGTAALGLFGELAPGHPAGQCHVGEQESHLGMAIEQTQPLRPGGGGQHPVAEFAQQI